MSGTTVFQKIQKIRMIFATTPNFLNGFLTYVSGKSRIIKFKGLPPIEMTPYEYNFFVKPVYLGYSIRKDGNEWELHKEDVFFRTTKDTFNEILWEDLTPSQCRPLEFKGKTVLDVGGYIGDSAVLFHHLGAEKIIIYEPVKEHIPLLMKNIELNHINAEVKNLGVGKSKGVLVVPFLKLDQGFGLVDGNTETWEKKSIVLEDIKTVIIESHADIAKFDCEGCEEAILCLDCEIIRTIPAWLLDIHREPFKKQLLEKFSEAGFENVWSYESSSLISHHVFKRV